jgi:hypothetical protein
LEMKLSTPSAVPFRTAPIYARFAVWTNVVGCMVPLPLTDVSIIFFIFTLSSPKIL